MKKFTITEYNFLEWLYESGQDSENTDLKLALADKVIDALQRGVPVVTAKDLFDDEDIFNSSIRLSFLEEFEDDEDTYDTELGSLDYEYELTLIK